MITRMKAAVRQVTERVRVADERGRVPPQPAAAARLVEADEVIKALHELQLIAQSSRPDRRSVAYAIAALRGELSGGPSDQASLFGLYVKGLPRLRDEWLNDEDARLKQALAFRALSAAERESFVAARAAPPTDEDRMFVACSVACSAMCVFVMMYSKLCRGTPAAARTSCRGETARVAWVDHGRVRG